MKINSKEYWEERFSSQDWEDMDVRAQTRYFAQLAIRMLPDWLKRDIAETGGTLCDVGCAEGDAAGVWHQAFPLLQITGADVSPSAVRTARERYPYATFVCEDLHALSGTFDYVLVSNVLEHFSDPFEILETLSRCVCKHLIVLVPFREPAETREKEHEVSFDYETIPLSLSSACLSGFGMNEEASVYWPGRQALLLYSVCDSGYGGMNNARMEAQQEKIRSAIQRERMELDWRTERERLDTLLREERQRNQAERERQTQERERLEQAILYEQQAVERLNAALQAERDAAAGRASELENALDVARQDAEAARQGVQRTHTALLAAERELHAAQAWLHTAASSRPYKAAQLVVRTRYELLSGDKQKRAAFFRWLGEKNRASLPVSEKAYLGQAALHLGQAYATLREHLSPPQARDEALLQELSALLETYAGDTVFVLKCTADFDIELFQRPQQIALAMGQLGVMFLYLMPNYCDQLDGIHSVGRNCCLVPLARVDDSFYQCIHACGKKSVFVFLSPDTLLTAADIARYKRLTDAVVYEYIDAISEEITGTVPDCVLERHQAMLHDPDVYVLSTASVLHDEVMRARGGNTQRCLLSSNGVDIRHFRSVDAGAELPDGIREIVAKKKPVIGYFGAIAKWLDCSLLLRAAQARPEYEFLLVGPVYHSGVPGLERLGSVENVTLCGAVDYRILPAVAQCFTVATIPFVVNEVTESTSPIKLFEYMAMGKQVVVTDMPECRKYPVLIANNAEQYVQLLDQAVEKAGDPGVLAALGACAEAHDWTAKAADLYHLVCGTHENRMEWLFLSAIDWDFRYQRPQQLASRLAAAGHRVTYINTDFKQAEQAFVREGVDVLSLDGSDLTEQSVYLLHREEDFASVFSQIDAYLARRHIRTVNVVVEYPSWQPVARQLQEKYGFRIIFDCLDDYEGFTNTNANPILPDAASWLKQNSDAVVASSRYLFDGIGATDAKTALIRNGADSARFAEAAKLPSRAERKTVGYYGAIADWFDVELVAYAARALPDCRFRLVGDYGYADVSALRCLKNVELPGEAAYAELCRELADFDVCIIPFKASLSLIQATNPVKFYEYVSAGKKVVSTVIPELSCYADELVLMDNTKEGFTDAIRRCLAGTDGLLPVEKRREAGRKNDWSLRVSALRELAEGLWPSVSVVVLTFNNADYNVACIQSIYEQSQYPRLEVIAVDNASSDDTPERLRMLQKLYPSLKVILHTENKGFAGGVNAGIRASTGEYVVILNNDTVVTAGWLSGMERYFRDAGAPVGAVGSTTNEIGNEARVEAGYAAIGGLQDFAAERSRRLAGKSFDIPTLAMFCTMIPRRVIDRIGLLDERFQIGMFEDDDYSRRLHEAGYRTLCADDVYIHHYGRSAFKLLGEDTYQSVFERNKRVYEEKHNQTYRPHSYRSDEKQ